MEEVPDAIPYDLRDSFAAVVGRAVLAGGGRKAEAKDVVRGLLGHGDGGDVLSKYWDDDQRHQELAQYSPLRQLAKEGEEVPENRGAPLEMGDPTLETGGSLAEIGGSLVEIGGLEPPTSALRTPRSPS